MLRKSKLELRQTKISTSTSQKQIFQLQSKYEDLLQQRDEQLEAAKSEHKQAVDKYLFEIDYLRKESTDLMRNQLQPAEEMQFRTSGHSNGVRPVQPSPYV